MIRIILDNAGPWVLITFGLAAATQLIIYLASAFIQLQLDVWTWYGAREGFIWLLVIWGLICFYAAQDEYEKRKEEEDE